MLYTLSTKDVADLLLAGGRILAAMWTDTEGLLTQFRETPEPEPMEV